MLLITTAPFIPYSSFLPNPSMHLHLKLDNELIPHSMITHAKDGIYKHFGH